MAILRLLAIAAIASASCTTATFAEEGSSDALDYRENYRLSLRYQSPDGEKTTIEFVVSAQSFEVSTFEPRLRFTGSILSTDGKDIVLQYKLGLERQVATSVSSGEGQKPFQTVSREQGGLSSNVRLELGSPIEIFAVGKEKAQLVVSTIDQELRR